MRSLLYNDKLNIAKLWDEFNRFFVKSSISGNQRESLSRLKDNLTARKACLRKSQLRKKEPRHPPLFAVMRCSVFLLNFVHHVRIRLFICTSASVIIRTEYRL